MRLPALITLVLAALVLAGCGGTKPKPVTKAQYNQLLAGIGTNLYTAANNLGQGTARQIFNDGVQNLQDTLKQSADELAHVIPPGGPQAEAANTRLIKAYGDLRKEFDKVKDARRESFPKAVEALKRVQRSGAARESILAAQDLRKVGFTVPVSATIGGSA